jgi:hypothetical protein
MNRPGTVAAGQRVGEGAQIAQDQHVAAQSWKSDQAVSRTAYIEDPGELTEIDETLPSASCC